MEIRNNLPLVEVEYESNNQKAVLTFLDKEASAVRVVNFNRQVFRDGKYVADENKAAKVDGWCQELFNAPFDALKDCVGHCLDVYVYDTFNSLFPVDVVSKFTEDMNREIFESEIKEIRVDDIAIRIRYDIDGKTYETKHSFATYMKSLGEWFVDPLKKAKMFEKFEERYGVPVEDCEKLIGHKIMVEVKSAFGENYYGEIKAFPKKKK